MAKVASKPRKRPGLTRRMTRSTLRAGMLATAVMVGRKTAGGPRSSAGPGAPPRGGGGSPGLAPAAAAAPSAGLVPGAGGPAVSQGLGAAAGGGPSAGHQTDPRAVANDDRGRGADTPQEIPAKGWKDIAKRTGKEVKADQVPLLAAGVAFYTLLALFPAIIAGVSIYGLVAAPQTVRDQINQLAQTLSPETATLIGQQIEQVTSSAGGALGLATVIGILTALWSASSGMKALITGVNLAYDETETRKFAKLRGLALLMTLGAMALL